MAFDRIRQTLDNVRYKNWKIALRFDGGRPYLQVQFMAPDANTGDLVLQKCRKWMLSTHMTESEIVATAFKACLSAEEHECREAFRYLGQPVFSPHLDVNKLARVIRDGGESIFDVRHQKDEE